MSASEVGGKTVKTAQMTLKAANCGANGVIWPKDFGW
jgi:hypothetical protein